MKNKTLYSILCTLLIASLSCSLVTEKSVPGVENEAEAIQLGEVFTSYEGGYSFRSIPGYSLEEQWGIANMRAPDAHEVNGPLVQLIGGLNNDPRTSEEIYFSFLDGLDATFSVEVETRITLEGSEAFDAELEGISKGETIRMRVVISAITSTQQFTLAAIAPLERWEEVAPYFDAVLATVEFFEPEIVKDPEPESEQGDEIPPPTEEPVISEPEVSIPSYVPYPDELEKGKFIFTVAGHDQDATIKDGFIQDQSTTNGFVIGLMQAGDFARYFLTIMLKLDTQPGVFAMQAYDKSAASKAPTAAIFIGAWYYYAASGTYEITDITHDTVSGRFYFEALRDDGNGTVIVSGAFNQVPLVWK